MERLRPPQTFIRVVVASRKYWIVINPGGKYVDGEVMWCMIGGNL